MDDQHALELKFAPVFDFLDKNGDGLLTKDEMRYVMNGMGFELTDDELRELVSEIAGVGESVITQEQFLSFCADQLQADPESELRETWKIMSGLTKTKANSDEPKPQQCITAKDVEVLMERLGGEFSGEEADELIIQAARATEARDALTFEEMIHLLAVSSS